MQISLAGKTAVVTGAASGIGLAMTRAFLESGADGVVAVFLEGPIATPLLECKARFQERLQFVQGDVGQESTAIAFVRKALDAFGRLDILVNNAAVSVVKAIHEHTPEEWDAVMNTNVKAVFLAARHAVPVMIRQGGGAILTTGSISGQVGLARQGAYAASKGALHQMTRQMAIEYAKNGIRVNAVACGTVDTPLVHQSAKDSGDEDAFWSGLRRAHPIGRVATPEEVAKFFVYLASDDASFFTGSIISMDGGFTAQ
jgi:NAD(P)-dependent dehydrogenase (short-subunit alcohol dehydrogenase family)